MAQPTPRKARALDLGALGLLTGALALCGAMVAGLFAAFDLGLEKHGGPFWLMVIAAAVGSAGGVTRWARRVPLWEILAAVGLVLAGGAVFAWASGADMNLAGAAIRTLFLAPPVLLLCSYLGASVAFLIWGDGASDLQLGVESLVGSRFLLSKASPVISTVTTISVIGVTLGVGLVIGALAILSGFEQDLEEKIIGANAHILVQKDAGRLFDLAPEAFATARATPGVAAASPYIEGEVALASGSNYTGGLLFGIDPKLAPGVLTVFDKIRQTGALDKLDPDGVGPVDVASDAARDDDAGDSDDPFAAGQFDRVPSLPGIIIGVEMQRSLNVGIGDSIRVISPLIEEMTPVGMVPRSRSFKVVGLFSSKMYEFDARYAYISLQSARSFFQAGNGDVSGLQVRASSSGEAAEVARSIETRLAALASSDSAHAYEALDWAERNKTLFSALKLERVVSFVVLVFIILVASFAIVITLTMSVVEKQKEIAILKTMGARDQSIMKIFLVQGMLVGGVGTLFGALLGRGFILFLQSIGVWIPEDVYYIDALPVKLDYGDIGLVLLAAFVIVWVAAVFPALRGARLDPLEGLRDG